jgi:hypothetical protein
MVRPSAANITISARLASDVKKRSVSSLCGACSSPIKIPATNTARNPEPCSTDAAP